MVFSHAGQAGCLGACNYCSQMICFKPLITVADKRSKSHGLKIREFKFVSISVLLSKNDIDLLQILVEIVIEIGFNPGDNVSPLTTHFSLENPGEIKHYLIVQVREH